MLIQVHKYTTFIGALLWIALGIITVGSIALSSIGWVINLIFGLLFILIGVFIWSRMYYLNRFLIRSSQNVQLNIDLQRYLRLEIVLAVGILFVGLILLMGASSRVFGEGFAVFG